jgi:hypothetical protein
MRINNDDMKKRSGTSFKSYVYATYEQLVKCFGKPTTNGDNYKVDIEWIIETPHGVATIYNYKNGKAYLGNKGLELKQITEWHVGGSNSDSYVLIKKRIEETIGLSHNSVE